MRLCAPKPGLVMSVGSVTGIPGVAAITIDFDLASSKESAGQRDPQRGKEGKVGERVSILGGGGAC